MLSSKVIGRVATSIELSQLYDSMLEAASKILIDRLQMRFAASDEVPHTPPTLSMRRAHLREFGRRREAFLRACRRQNIKILHGLSVLDVQRHLLQSLMSSLN